MTTPKHAISDELLTSLLANYLKPEDLIGEYGLFKQVTNLKRLECREKVFIDRLETLEFKMPVEVFDEFFVVVIGLRRIETHSPAASGY